MSGSGLHRPRGGVCVATVTTASFLPGTLVTLGSFLRQHPDFAGDLVVIHDELPDSERACLAALPKLRFEQVSSGCARGSPAS